jgi:hypothetical protein
MKLWIDDVRPAPEGYVHCVSVNQAILKIQVAESVYFNHGDVSDTDIISIIDIDHDAGDYASDGGDYIKLLDWLEETGRNYPIRIHSQNPVGVANMRLIIERNGWEEIK